jgi:hypothetical protein
MKIFIMILLASCSLQGCAKSSDEVNKKIVELAREEALYVLGFSTAVFLEPRDYFLPLNNWLIIDKQAQYFSPLQSYLDYIIKANDKERVFYLNETIELAERCTQVINFYDAFPRWFTSGTETEPGIESMNAANSVVLNGIHRFRNICVGAHVSFVLFNRTPVERKLIADFYRKHYKGEINAALKPETKELEWLKKYHVESINELTDSDIYEAVTHAPKLDLNETIFPYLEKIEQGLVKSCFNYGIKDCDSMYLEWKFDKL